MSYNLLTLDQYRKVEHIKAWIKTCLDRNANSLHWFERAEQEGLLEHIELFEVSDNE